MAFPPLIERDLRLALRKQHTVWSRFRTAAFAVAVAALFLMWSRFSPGNARGRSLEMFFSLAGLFFVLRTPGMTAGVLADERRNQTLGLLFLTGMSPGEIFLSKLLSTALRSFTNLLVIFPLLALPFLLGGVSHDVYVGTLCGLPVLMFFALAVSILGSAMSQDEGAALVVAHATGAAVCLAPLAAGYLGGRWLAWPPLSDFLSQSSPAYGVWLAGRGISRGWFGAEKTLFWQCLGCTLGWAVLALGCAAFELKRVWRETGGGREIAPWRRRGRDWLHGSLERRKWLARQWLERNPFVWLASRDRQPVMLGWLATAGVCALWLFCWALLGKKWVCPATFFLAATLLNFVLLWTIRLAAAQQIGLGRRDGSYELLLTTPLEPENIVEGELAALQTQFAALAGFLLCLEFTMILAGLEARAWTLGTLAIYLTIWLAMIIWSWSLWRQTEHAMPVMWASLNSGQPMRAWVRTSSLKGLWGWVVAWNVVWLARGAEWTRFPSGSTEELILLGISAVLTCTPLLMNVALPILGRAGAARSTGTGRMWLILSAAAAWRQRRLIAEFREIAREPLPDANDRRFKHWNARERFPWGWEMVQTQLHERLARRAAQTTGRSDLANSQL